MANTIEIVIKATDKASAIINKIGQSLGPGVAGAATGILAANAALGKFQGMVNAVAGAPLTQLVVGLGKTAFELGNLGAQTLRTEAAFARVVGSSSEASRMLNELKEATRGTRSEAELMESATNLIALGFGKSSEQLAGITRNVEALGARFGGTMQTFQLMMANKTLMRIDSFGIGVAEATQRINEFKAAGMDANAAFDAAILELMNEKYQLLGGAVDDAISSQQRLKASWADLKAEIGKGLAPTVDAVVGSLADAATSANQHAEQMRIGAEVFGKDYVIAAQAAQRGVASAAQELERMNQAIAAMPQMEADIIAQGYSDVGTSARDSAAGVEAYAAAQAQANEAAAAAAVQFNSAAAALGELSEASFVQAQIKALEQAKEEGIITTEQYAAAQEALLVQSGLLTEQERQTQGAINEMIAAMGEGGMEADQYASSVLLLKQRLDELESKEITVGVNWDVSPMPDLGGGGGGGGTPLGSPSEMMMASGFEGVFTRPTRAVFGEAGPEYVKAVPLSSTTTNVNNGGDTIYINNGAQAMMVMQQKARMRALANSF